ncbi:hypothetical protein QJS10_CPB20g00898 [Acorus calamus]|uniref:Uncharacterized protein n=1 Tax=Acorus calamus TaxID=4465 RepID=A0AAV9CA09_ACOCL|nr:hypothetical protein QJS10_CPB20g00898 [Acorus calamus]
MVTDDMVVTPFSSMSGIRLIRSKLGDGDLEEIEPVFGKEEVTQPKKQVMPMDPCLYWCRTLSVENLGRISSVTGSFESVEWSYLRDNYNGILKMTSNGFIVRKKKNIGSERYDTFDNRVDGSSKRIMRLE